MSFTLIVAAVLPALLMVWYLVRRDLYPEPTHVLVGTFLLGAFAVVPAALATGWVLPIAGGAREVPIAALIYAFIIVAPLEELSKFTVLVGFAGRRSHFNEPMDGMVYGGVAGLGFAAAENVAYVAIGGLELALLRAITTVPMHAAVGAIMGFFYGLSRYVPERRQVFLTYALLVPIALHGAYNYPLIVSEILAALDRHMAWLEPLALAILAFQIGTAMALLRRLRSGQRAGHHEAAADADFLSIHTPFRRFSSARHLKGPAAVVSGGVLIWLTGTALLTLLAGWLGAWLNAPPASPFGRAEANAADILGGFARSGQLTIIALLALLLLFGLWLFARGIVWLNREDRPRPAAAPVGPW